VIVCSEKKWFTTAWLLRARHCTGRVLLNLELLGPKNKNIIFF
jgi:hypothetical protein